MSIYWERCDICGKHKPVKQCWLHPERNVCPYCCLACPERSMCPNPVWFPSLRTAERIEKKEDEEARRALEELLRRLEAS